MGPSDPTPQRPGGTGASPSLLQRVTAYYRSEGRSSPELCARLVVARGQTGLAVHEFANLVGCSAEVLMALERGAMPPSAAPVQIKRLLQSSVPRAERVAGCLLGGAVGDALGAGIEFLDLHDIHQRFGPLGVTGYTPAYGRVGAVTDDTQMTLFTAEGLLAGGMPDDLWASYNRWLRVQGGSLASGWLAEQPFLHHGRAPGTTCVSAIRAGRMGSVDQPLNDSKGCGGVMRVAPCGVTTADLKAAFSSGVTAAVLTHGHPSGYLAAGALAALVHAVLDGLSLDAAIEPVRAELVRWEGHGEVLAAVDAAVSRAANSPRPSVDDVIALGEGWVAEEALSIALFSALACVDVRSGLLLAANHGGDSDSTAAIAGNLLGAALGVEAIPQEWLDDLEGRDVIATVAEQLAGLRP